MAKDLRTILGKPVRGRYSRIYCGGGQLVKCRRVLRASLRAAVDELVAEYGSDPAAWDAQEDRDRIQFAPVGIQGQDSMQWQNRPTFQQLLEFEGA